MQRARLDAREGELLALEAGADFAQRVVAAGVEDEEFVLGGRGGLQELLHQDALAYRAGFAVHLRVDGGDDIAFLRGDAVAREVDERQIGPGGARLEPVQRLEEPLAVEIEAAGRLAVAGDDLEAGAGEQLHRRLGVGHGIIEPGQSGEFGAAAGIGVLADDECHAPRPRRGEPQDQRRAQYGEHPSKHAPRALQYRLSQCVAACAEIGSFYCRGSLRGRSVGCSPLHAGGATAGLLHGRAPPLRLTAAAAARTPAAFVSHSCGVFITVHALADNMWKSTILELVQISYRLTSRNLSVHQAGGSGGGDRETMQPGANSLGAQGDYR